MRKYETVFISDPDLKDQARTDLYDRVRNIIANEKGVLLDFDEWGNKKLAYEIKKKYRGQYVCATYGGNGDLVNELERNFRLTDAVLKFMTIVLSEDMPKETFEKEVEQAAEESKEAEESAETETVPEDTKEDTEPEEKQADADSDEKVEVVEEAEVAETATEPEEETEKKA